MEQQLTHYVLKGGRIIDPAAGRDGLFDIRVCDGKVDAIGANLESGATPSPQESLIRT